METLTSLASGADEGLFLLINNGLSNPALDIVMTFFSVVGDAPGWILCGLAFIYFSDRTRFRRRSAIFLLTMGVAGLFLNLSKDVVGRGRPLERFKHEIAAGKVVIHAPYETLTARSFPSGHSQAAFTAATFLFLYYRRFGVVLFACAMMVAVSRVYVGSHFPADVVVGSAFGWGMGYVAWRLDPSQTQREKTA
ncbi:MAG: phosphatase PAP2 family protein [Nitrospinae bacterium]|nr:phosphatase PAP2 family protein [Nitrospinota bacterium]MBF0633898.1 phosphatase PAP2 family protein [Nitrospinota bacterium]